jgi:selenium-binding protein 1
MTNPDPIDVRRRKDGSLDLSFYIDQAHCLRSASIRGTPSAIGRFLARLAAPALRRRPPPGLRTSCALAVLLAGFMHSAERLAA